MMNENHEKNIQYNSMAQRFVAVVAWLYWIGEEMSHLLYVSKKKIQFKLNRIICEKQSFASISLPFVSS